MEKYKWLNTNNLFFIIMKKLDKNNSSNRSMIKGVSFPQEMWNKIDKDRGDIPRSRFILNMVKRVLDIKEDYNYKK